jgi:hypothetical protein
MKAQGEFAANGMVSVWVGNFSSEAEFDVYMNLNRDFETDFGFKIDNGSIREGAVEDHAMPIDRLVAGFSNWNSFAPAVIEACQNLGVTKATTMIVIYTIMFQPSTVTINPRARLSFVGAFPFR